jgi:hypothetical protein
MSTMGRCRRFSSFLLFVSISTAILLSAGLAGPAWPACEEPCLFHEATLVQLTLKPRDVVVTDVSGDGILDIVVPCPDTFHDEWSDSIAVILGNGGDGVGDGTFGSPQMYGTGSRPMMLVTGDFDGDDILDLAVSNWADASVSVLHGYGNGTFGPWVRFPAGERPYGIVTADFDGDGILDLATADNGDRTVSVLTGLGSGGVGDGTFASPVPYEIADLSTALAVGDLNGDDVPDLVATSNYHKQVSVLLGIGNGTFAAAQHFAAGKEPYDVAIQDLDGDDVPDVVAANGASGGVNVLKGLGDGSLGEPAIFANGVNCGGLAFGDYDQDGIQDLAVTYSTGHAVEVLLGGGAGGIGDGTFEEQGYYTGVTFPLSVASADFNEDGYLDLAVASYGSGDVAVFLGGCFTPGPSAESPHLVSVQDVPNDQGGKVFLRWTRSSLDRFGRMGITGYRVWRRLPSEAATELVGAVPLASAGVGGERAIRTVNPSSGELEYWEALATLPAEGLGGYGYAAATTQDSLPGSNPYTAFFVTALTSDVATFYPSNVDSGYSVDNLAPAQPSPFLAEYGATWVALHWGVSRETDLFGYRLYRGTEPTFVPGPENLLVAKSDTGYVDQPGSCAFYYKLSAVDLHGNESRFAMVTPAGPTGALAALESARYGAGGLRLVWSAAANPGLQADLYRWGSVGGWKCLGTLTADGTGRLVYTDEAVSPGRRYGYRLGIWDGDREVFAGEVWVDVPALVLALRGVRPNPVMGSGLNVSFTLPGPAPARLELFDVAGRLVRARDVGELGAGHHEVDLGGGEALPAGLYLVRLTQGGRPLSLKVVALE